MSDQTAPTYLEPIRDELDRLRTLLDDRSAALNRTAASNDRLRAQLAAVEKVAADCERMGQTAIHPQNREWLPLFASTLRAALAVPTDQEPAK